jgi:hypothetical protein
MRFSQRIGKKEIKNIIQKDSIDEDLKNSLWNLITVCYWDNVVEKDFINNNNNDCKNLLKRIWSGFFKKRLDEMPEFFHLLKNKIKLYFFDAEWYEVYDFIEFLPNNYSIEFGSEINEYFIEACNKVLSKELSAYRFVGNVLAEISSEVEINSIKDALINTDKYRFVKLHLNRSLELLSDRKNPDYRNSIKESISAVESYCALITNDKKATLGQALKQIEQKTNIHPALKKSFSNLYGYTSEADGIRHALLEEHSLSQEDAKFMLVSCSAFINYLIQKEV